VRQSSLGVMAVCALIVLRIFGKAAGRAMSAAPMPSLGQLQAGEAAAGLLPAGAGREAEPLMLRKQIAAALQSNPEQTRELFFSWLEEKGG